jgi:hypothetical protein
MSSHVIQTIFGLAPDCACEHDAIVNGERIINKTNPTGIEYGRRFRFMGSLLFISGLVTPQDTSVLHKAHPVAQVFKPGHIASDDHTLDSKR